MACSFISPEWPHETITVLAKQSHSLLTGKSVNKHFHNRVFAVKDDKLKCAK